MGFKRLNKAVFVLFYILIQCKFYGQSIRPNILNIGGNSTNSISINLEWNLGESISIQTFSASNLVLTSGLLQPGSQVVTAISEFGPNVFGTQIIIGPNPTTNFLNIIGHFMLAGRVQVQIIDASSKIIAKDETFGHVSFYDKAFQLDPYPPGLYFIKVVFKPIVGESINGIYKIIKQ